MRCSFNFLKDFKEAGQNMICFICEKRIETEDREEEYTFFVAPYSSRHKRVYKNSVVETGFHMECLKDSLSEDDFELFFEKVLSYSLRK